MNENFDKAEMKRRYAWATFKHFLRNPELLRDEKNSELFLRSKKIMIDYHANVNQTNNREAVEKVMFWLADEENLSFPPNLTLTEEIINIINEDD